MGNSALLMGLGGDLEDAAMMHAASQGSNAMASGGMNVFPTSDSPMKYIQGLNYLKNIGYNVDNMSPYYAQAAKKMIDDSVLGEDQGTFTINGQTYISPDKVDRLAAIRREEQSETQSKPFYKNAF